VLRQLPICPAAFEDESVDSWLERVGREYGSSRARLLCATGIRQRLGPRRYPIDPIRPHELPAIAALTGNSLTGLRRKAALSPPAWTIRARNDFIFCLHCHLADHFEPGPKHVRASWYSAGRVCCLIHRHWLWSARARFGCGRIDRSLREHEELPLSVWSEHFHAECTALDRIWESDPEVPLALRELESTIHAARRDVAPDEDEWGRLDAAEFLLVFRDVASWSLTNFQPFPALPAASTAIGQRSIAYLQSFHWGHRRHLPWDHRRGAIEIHTAFDPSVRRGALWAAHALMAVRHPRDPRDRRAHCLRERRSSLFRYENAESMAWLVACARHWPRAYVRDHWDGMAELRKRL
jgi:hypothetical protein